MASVSKAGSGFGPKLRSRKHGAATPLDDLDKRLLNLMQGKFPIAQRPYQDVAAEAGITEQQAIDRVSHLQDERIIRQVTPIFDTRALGYSSMLVAAKVDPENPWRAANIINEHPGVSHNYLRNHEFNIWFTIATEPDSKLGLDGTLEALANEAGAESVRQLPTLKLFKIRMDLEMEGGTDALAKAVEVAPPAETERQPYDEFDIEVIRATQGDMPVIPEPYAPAAEKLDISQDELLTHLQADAGAPAAPSRRRDPLPPPRRLQRQRHGRVEGARRSDHGDRAKDGGVPRHLPLLPAPDLRGLAVLDLHDGPRPLEGGVRRDPRLDRLRDRDRRAHDAVLLDRVQEDPAAVLHRRASRLGTRARGRVSAPPSTTSRSAEIYRRAVTLLPGGVNSPVRAMRSIGRDPIFIASGHGSTIIDVDGNEYIDWVCFVGSADPGARASRRGGRRHRGGAARHHVRRAHRRRGDAR